MIRIPAGAVRLWVLGGVSPVPSVTLGAYLIDRHEVTNRAFAQVRVPRGSFHWRVERAGYVPADLLCDDAVAFDVGDPHQVIAVRVKQVLLLEPRDVPDRDYVVFAEAVSCRASETAAAAVRPAPR